MALAWIIRSGIVRLLCALTVTALACGDPVAVFAKAPPRPWPRPTLNLFLRNAEMPPHGASSRPIYAATARPDPWEELGDTEAEAGDDAIPRNHLAEHVPGGLPLVQDILGGTTIPLFRITLKAPL